MGKMQCSADTWSVCCRQLLWITLISLPAFYYDLVQVNLGAAIVGGSQRKAWMALSNAGALPLDWELVSYDEPLVCCSTLVT